MRLQSRLTATAVITAIFMLISALAEGFLNLVSLAALWRSSYFFFGLVLVAWLLSPVLLRLMRKTDEDQ